jgi:hypothetical protein
LATLLFWRLLVRGPSVSGLSENLLFWHSKKTILFKCYKYWRKAWILSQESPSISLSHKIPIKIFNANIMSRTQEAVSARYEHILDKFHGLSIPIDPVLSFNADETAESYIFRLTDLVNPMRSHIPSTDVLSRAIILTLLQCAARLFPGQQFSTQASDLIGCADFRGILKIGFGSKFDKVCQLNALSKVGLEPTTAEKWSQNYTRFAASRKMEANLVWSHANLLHGLARLYETHKAVLQNSCAPPGMGEGFMFQNYTDLVAQLSLSDKAGLVTLLPDVFYWGEAEDHHDSTSTVPERALLAKLPKESHGTNGLREWLPNIDFTSDTTPSPSTCADSSISDPNATRSKSNAEAHVSDKYQETLTGGILLEILKANAKTGILPKSFGPLPTIDEGDIGTCRQGESGKLRVSE